MHRRALACLLVPALWTAERPAHAADDLVVVAHAPLRGVDAVALRRLYTGRALELDGQPVKPVNLPTGHPLRAHFLAAVVQQSEDDYVAYWTVRRYAGRGAPPPELDNPAAVLEYVRATPGAVGYVGGADVRPGVHVVWRR